MSARLLYPCKVSLETVDVQLRLLGVDVGADGEEVLRRGGENDRQRGRKVFGADRLMHTVSNTQPSFN